MTGNRAYIWLLRCSVHDFSLDLQRIRLAMRKRQLTHK